MLTVFIFIPFGYSTLTLDGEATTVEGWYPYQSSGLLIPAALGAILALVDIFLYKNFPAQKLVAKLAIVVILVAVAVTVYFLVAGFIDPLPGQVIANTKWGGGGLLLLASLIAVAMALSHIKADERLLRSMDRVR